MESLDQSVSSRVEGRRRPISVVAIDGPAASGKTTIGLRLAKWASYRFLDTGKMYRAVTLSALRKGIDVDDESKVVALSQRIDIELGKKLDEEFGQRLYIDGDDVTAELHSAAVDVNVSVVSAYEGVRSEMVRRQRAFAASGRIVIVGRDIGTVVAPNARLKLFIDATPEERARRRWREQLAKGESRDLSTILEQVRRRDGIDSSREYSPLMAASDAVLIDTSDRGPDEIFEQIRELLVESGLGESEEL